MNRIFGFVAMFFLMAMAFLVQPQEASAVLMYGSENFDGVLGQYWAYQYTDADTGLERVSISVDNYTKTQNIYWGDPWLSTSDNYWQWGYVVYGKYEEPQYQPAHGGLTVWEQDGFSLAQYQVIWGWQGVEVDAGASISILNAELTGAAFYHNTWEYDGERYFSGQYYFWGQKDETNNHSAVPEPVTAGLSILGLSALSLSILRRRQC